MAKYLISFPSAAMVVPDGEWEAVGRDAHAVIDEAKAAGVYVFGGGIDEAVPARVRSRVPLAPLARRGPGGSCACGEALPLPPRATSVRVRSRFLRSMVPLSLVPAEQPNKSLQPTPVGVVSSADAGRIVDPAWLSFCR